MPWIIIALVAIIIDQISKYIIIQNISEGSSIPIIDGFFHLTYIENSGAAWGILQNGRMIFLIIIPIISMGIVYYMIKHRQKMLRFSLSLVLAGAIGNYIDRVRKGSVTDFIDFYIGTYDFPKFNVADMCVVIGTALLAYYMLFIYKEGERQTASEIRKNA